MAAECANLQAGVSTPRPGENIRIVMMADSRADFHRATRLT